MTSTQTPATAAEPGARRRPTTLLRVGAVLAALLAVTDVAGAIPFLGGPMPIEIGVAIFVIAALTIVGAVAGFLGRAWGVWLAAVTRFLSIGAMIPVFTEPGAPAEAAVPTAIQIVVTVVVIVLLMVGLARRK
jgi:hypothetical protein